MRFLRLAAFLAWILTASLAVAGFAAFAPSQPPPPSSTTTPPAQVASDRGALAGRVAALALASQQVPAGPSTTIVLTDTDAMGAARSYLATTTTTTTTTRPRPTTPRPPTTMTTVTTTPPPDTLYVPPGTEPWLGLVQLYFQPADHQTALMVIWCESRGDPYAVNPLTGAAGLFQHLPKYWDERAAAAGVPGSDIFDPATNTIVAAWLVYDFGGWYRHWYPVAGCADL